MIQQNPTPTPEQGLGGNGWYAVGSAKARAAFVLRGKYDGGP
jgi:hypothetical protein